MQGKKALITIIGIILVATFGYFFFLFSNQSHQEEKQDSAKPFEYGEFLKENPAFTEEDSLSKEKKYKEMGQKFEQALPSVQGSQQKAYAKYLVVRAYVNAARQDDQDTDSLNKALDFATKDIQNEQYPNIRVLLIDLIDFLMYPGVSQQTKVAVMKHPFFDQFDTHNGKISEFRKNLLNYGNNIYRLTNIKMKLTLLSAQELQRMNKKKSSESLASFDQKKSDTLILMQDADASLKKDLSGEAPFKNPSYTVEPIYIKAIAADTYYRVTKELPWGEIDALYQDALSASSVFPELRPYIEKTYAGYQEYKKGVSPQK